MTRLRRNQTFAGRYGGRHWIDNNVVRRTDRGMILWEGSPDEGELAEREAELAECKAECD